MKVGISSVNITPPIGVPMAGYSARMGSAKEIHDDLYAKAIVFNDKDTKAALVRCDLIGLERDFVEETRRLIESETGIDRNNIMITCTHTHSGPITDSLIPDLDAWMKVLSRKIKGAVIAANRNLKEAKIGFNRGSVEGIVINRRKPGGPVDTEVGIIRIDDLAGNPMAVLINYACHAVVLGPDNLLISADYPGFVMDFVERNLGVPALFVNGACGDINPLDKLTVMRQKRKEDIYDRHGGTFEEAKRLGNMIGAEAVKVFLGTETENDLELKVASREIKIPLVDLPSIDELKRMLEENENLFRKLVSEKDAAHAFRIAMLIQYARSTIKYVESGENVRPTEIQVFRIGDGVLIALPGEIFVEIGLDIKKKSGLKHTFICELANDAIGYVPTREAFKEPGYEVGVARRMNYTDDIGCIIEDEALKTLAMLS
ncbi:neutral/alkaline non-lysosomal ceramidase N-terminal domain-containing protein [Candidatus Bathyarchaeota archaeon]|nr:neutral/alkaline non-lysosomal ceramidase N-terminal domain-containing protein [Candidatus Bathyarchaeota archaeon]